MKKKLKNRKKLKKLSMLLFLIAAIELVISGAFYAYSIPSIHEAIVLATTVKPERFTELYFENHLTLPKEITVDKTENFSFTIHNLEYREMIYDYEVYIPFNNEKQMIDAGKISLPQDGYKTVKEDYMITLPTKRVEVIVNLKNKNQQIDFWIEGM